VFASPSALPLAYAQYTLKFVRLQKTGTVRFDAARVSAPRIKFAAKLQAVQARQKMWMK
jgi:hypothetical protein